MLVITSDRRTVKATSSLTGQTVIGFVLEPGDNIRDCSEIAHYTIISRLELPTNFEQLRWGVDSLLEYLHHAQQE